MLEKTPIQLDLAQFPSDLRPFLSHATAQDCSSHSSARVYKLSNQLYLKIDQTGRLQQEAELTRFFHHCGIGVEVVAFVSADRDYFLTRAADGQTALSLYADPDYVSSLMGHTLCRLHDALTTNEQVRQAAHAFSLPNRRGEYCQRVGENYRKGMFDPSVLLPQFGIKSREEAYQIFARDHHLFSADTLIHGDYCLPNIIVNNRRFSCFIDVGLAGLFDRHVDLFWGVWSLNYNLGTDAYSDRFLDSYGRDRVDERLLRLVCACEAFG